MRMEWDDYADWTALVEDHPEYMKEAVEKAEQKAAQRAVDKFRLSLEHAMLKNGISAEVVKACFQSLDR